jgi:hypothetical protein
MQTREPEIEDVGVASQLLIRYSKVILTSVEGTNSDPSDAMQFMVII